MNKHFKKHQQHQSTKEPSFVMTRKIRARIGILEQSIHMTKDKKIIEIAKEKIKRLKETGKE